MTNFQSRSWALLLALVSLQPLATSCANEDKPIEPIEPIEEPMLKGTISSYNKSGAAILDITAADMTNAGFTLGDVISITIDDKKIIMPYYDGFYNSKGEYLCVAYPTSPTIRFTANDIGLPQELRELEGHSVTIRMQEQGGSLNVQQAMSMTYSNNRSDYPEFSDAAYANVRAVKAGKIANGVLHRSSSPFRNKINRAHYVSEYLESEGIKTVLNLADNRVGGEH